MEQSGKFNHLEMYTLDLEELNKLIQISTRPNIKRQLEQLKLNLENLQNEEKRKNENSQKPNNFQQESTSQKSFVTVSKYAMESGEKFVK